MLARFGLLSLGLLIAVPATAQDRDVLTLNEALAMARQRNGDIIAARLQVDAARERVRQSQAAFWPTLTPSYTYRSNRQEFATTGGSRFVQDEGGSSLVSANWRLLDSGERNLNLRGRRALLAGQQFSSQQTLRLTLFSVTQQYFEALRSQELLKVSDQQVERAKQILDQIKARIAVEDAAEIEELQANADFQNARVQALVARNKVSTSSASLKGTIGLQADAPLPVLQEDVTIGELPRLPSLSQLMDEGLRDRPDLAAQRRSVESTRISHELAKRQAGITFGLDASFDQQITPRSLENRGLILNLSYPLFDGGERRAAVREAAKTLEADRAQLLQFEREVRAEIEASYAEASQNIERLDAARIALEAARRNYQAAIDSQALGAYDLLQVSTAQLSLVTAESSYIEALYDHQISDAKLRLATGRPVPGEVN